MTDKIFHETPILKTLEDYLSKNPIKMHVPFHSGISNNEIFPKEIYNFDISEVSGYDTEGKDNPIWQSESITAKYFCVEHSFYLTGGASVGLLAALIALNKFGRKVILSRNVHKSVINGVVLAGLEPIWLDVEFLNNWGIFSSVNVDRLSMIVSENNDIAGCVIVSPTYEGIISDVKKISEVCHSKNIPLIVDEAHGAHFYFLNHEGLTSAIQENADLVIQSWHKTLGSLTQSGVMHLLNEKYFTYNDIKRALDLVSSTSPSFLLLLSLELTRKNLAETKGALFNLLLNNLRSLKTEMNQIPELDILKNNDPFKIYLKTENISGIEFAYQLYKEHSIEIESANEIGFLMLVGNGFNDDIKSKIISALKEINYKSENTKNAALQIPLLELNESSNPLSLREAFMKGFLKDVEREVNCEIHAPCPPGYAINIPGTKKCK